MDEQKEIELDETHINEDNCIQLLNHLVDTALDFASENEETASDNESMMHSMLVALADTAVFQQRLINELIAANAK